MEPREVRSLVPKPVRTNTGHYAARVAELAQRRKVADLGGQLTRLAASGADPAELVATGRALLDEANTPGGWSPLIPLGRGRHLPAFPAELLPGWFADQAYPCRGTGEGVQPRTRERGLSLIL